MSQEISSEIKILIIVIGLENLPYIPYWKDSSLARGNALHSAEKLFAWVHILNGSIFSDKNWKLSVFL